MKELFESKNFLKTLIILGAVFIIVVVAQFVSIGVLKHKHNSLQNDIVASLKDKEYYEGLKEQAGDSTYAENYAKDELNMKNPDESVYKGN